jgi:hypothetical protein
MRRRAAAWLTALAASAVVVVGGAGCEKGDARRPGCPEIASGPPIDEPVMAFLSAARALHHEADIAEQSGDVAGAIARLENLVALPPARAVEVDEVLADARARLAELRLHQGDVAGAEREVRAGLERVAGPTYFRGHLLEVEGIVEEARAAALSDAGKASEAAAAKARALAHLEEAVRVQEEVISRALGDGGQEKHD